MTTHQKNALVLGLTLALLLGGWLAWQSTVSTPRPPGLAEQGGSSADATELVEVAHVDERQVIVAPEPSPSLPAPAATTEPEAEVELPGTALPPGEVLVLVLLDGEPVSSGKAHVFDGGFNAFPKDLSRDRKGMHHAPIGLDGRARFGGVGRGFQNIAVEVDPGYCQYTQRTLGADEGMRVVIALSSTGVAGRVFDEDGVPVEGASVFVDGPAEGLQCTTWTDFDGAYCLRGMPVGETELTKIQGGGHWFTGGGEKRSATLELGRTETLDFGTEEAWPRWTGAVRNAAGEMARLAVSPVHSGSLTLTDRTRGVLRQVTLADDGSIDIGMEPGTYEVALKVGYEKVGRIVEPALVMPAHDLQRDLELPGPIVRGQVRENGVGFDPGERLGQGVALYDLSTPGQAPDHGAKIDREGYFVINGVAPGTYKVMTHPRLIPVGVELVVLEADTELLLNLDLAPHRSR